jgi:hypothetical protein
VLPRICRRHVQEYPVALIFRLRQVEKVYRTVPAVAMKYGQLVSASAVVGLAWARRREVN